MLLPLPLGPLLSALAPPLCWACGAPAPAREPLCRGCRAQLRFLAPAVVELAGVRCWAAVAYEGPARELVRGLKYRGAAALADGLAVQIAASLPVLPASLAGWDALHPRMRRSRPSPPRTASARPLLVPVPMVPARRRRRGYDQAALLAAALGRRTGLRIACCLERRGAGRPQVGRGRHERRAALTGAIAVSPNAPVPPRVLLVDDVITTGATLAACAAALRRAGCPQVAAVAYARTLGR